MLELALGVAADDAVDVEKYDFHGVDAGDAAEGSASLPRLRRDSVPLLPHSHPGESWESEVKTRYPHLLAYSLAPYARP